MADGQQQSTSISVMLIVPDAELSPTDQLWPNGSRKPPWR
jgi:hypothetical protein